MSLKDILAAKAATPAAPKEEAEATQKASEERAAWNLHDKQSNALGHGQQNQATGMMSSADVLTAPLASPARPVTTAPLYAPEPFIVGDPNEDPNNIPPEPAAEPQKPGPAGSYRPLRLTKFYKADGTTVLPIDGFFVAKDEEEEEMLKHYLTQWDMVELQEKKKEK